MTTTPTTTGTQSNVPEATQREIDDLGRYAFGWADSDTAGATAKRGLSEQVVIDISARKNEPEPHAMSSTCLCEGGSSSIGIRRRICFANDRGV